MQQNVRSIKKWTTRWFLLISSLKYINCMKANQRKIYNLSDIQIVFQPKSITFNRAKDGNYRLYLEKNVQVIGQINETIKIHPKYPTYIFSSDLQVKPFRIINDKYCAYQISLYQLHQNGEETLKDSAEFTLNKFIKHYLEQFLRFDEQIKEKQKSSIADHWRALSNNFTRKNYSNTIKFKNVDAIMDFICVPTTEYDEMVKEDDLLREKKREIQEKSKKRNEFTKSKTLPTMQLVNKVSTTSKKYHQNDSDVVGSSDQKIMDEKAKKEMNESLKKFTIKIPETHKSPPETEPTSSNNSNQIISGLSNKSNPKNDKLYERSSSLVKEILINDPIDEEIEEKYSPEGTEKDYQSMRSRYAQLPMVQIKNIKSLQMAETNGSARMANLSLNSHVSTQKSQKKIEYKSNTKQSLLIAIWIFLNVFLIVYLMHPMSKF